MEEKPLAVRAQMSSFNNLKGANQIVKEILYSNDEFELNTIIDMPCMSELYKELAKAVLLKLALKRTLNQISNEIVVRIKVKESDLPKKLTQGLSSEPLKMQNIKLVQKEDYVYIFIEGKLGEDMIMKLIDSPADLYGNNLN